jgi:tetratricopeptide (TPR) repeat protein
LRVLRWIAAIVIVGLIAGGVVPFMRWWLLPPLPDASKPIEPGSELARLMFEADKASKAEDHPRAVELYTKALAIEPGPNLISRRLRELRGSEYNFLGSEAEAYADFDAAIAIRYSRLSDISAIRAYMGRGYAALHLGKYAQARDDFDIVLKEIPADVPRSSSTLAWRGAAWQGLRDRSRAVEDYEAALRLDPGNELAHKGLDPLGEKRP